MRSTFMASPLRFRGSGWRRHAQPDAKLPALPLVELKHAPILRESIIPWQAAVLKTNPVDPLAYRNAMARFAGAVHVVTTDGPAGRRGVTMTAVASVSDKPATLLICLNLTKASNELFVRNGCFAVNTLAAKHQKLADAFSGMGGLSADERFALGQWRSAHDAGATGAPVLADALASFDCVLTESHDLSTHRILIGRVSGVFTGDSQSALIYHERGYHVL